MNDKDIAEVLNIAPSSVRQYLTRARREAIIWPMNDHMYIIRGQIDKDTVVKITEGVKYIDKKRKI